MEWYNVLGIGVSAINMRQTLAIFKTWVDQRIPRYVCVADVHCIMSCQHDPHLKRIYDQAAMVTPDGMPLVWLGQLNHQPHVTRVYGPDLLLAVCEHAGYKHFFYGGAVGVPELLAKKLLQRFPHLEIVGTYTPPFSPLTVEEDEKVIALINESQADFVWVGLGATKQEYWMADHVGKLTAPILIGVGAAFDFISGTKPQAPRWMQNNGLEWLFRLATEPKRLWKRYVFSIPPFVILSLAQLLKLRRYSLDK